jgi:DNA-binding phage protein
MNYDLFRGSTKGEPMNDLQAVRARLRKAGQTRGLLAQIAKGSSVSERTIYNLIHSDGSPNLATLDKLVAYFKREDRRAAK